MFEELPFLFGFFLFSLVISYILLTYTPEPIVILVTGLSIIGIVIHELCHLLMCLLTNTPVSHITLVRKVKTKEHDRKFRYGGAINVEERNLTLLQALLICFAPLYLSFWLFFFLWEQISNPHISALSFFLYLFLMISISLSAAPSFPDLAVIPKAFQNDIYHSFYQILLIILSIGGVWFAVNLYDIFIFHEIFMYILIMLAYYCLKYGFRGLGYVLNWIKSMRRIANHRPIEINIRQFTRRRYKPAKPKKFR